MLEEVRLETYQRQILRDVSILLHHEYGKNYWKTKVTANTKTRTLVFERWVFVVAPGGILHVFIVCLNA